MAESAISTDDILGQEFLTWLWYKSDLAPNSFKDLNGESFQVSMEQRIVVQSGNGETKEVASVSGAFSNLSEAKYGLGMGKKVVRALLHLEKDAAAYQVTLKAEDFSLGSMRTPKIETKKEEIDADPDALFLEKIFLFEQGIGLLDALYKMFLDLRISKDWDAEVDAMRQWMEQDPT